MARLLLLAALCALAIASVAAIPLTSHASVRFGAVHGALNHRLTREQATADKLGTVQAQWMAQRLDHNDMANPATFQQRYFVNDSFLDHSNPRVFLMIGGEGPVSPAYVTDHFIIGELAANYKALIVTLEHRFYGQSIPGNDSSTANLRYLSSNLALEDLVQFREHISTQYSLPSTTKWVAFGGSYSGSLAAWARLKYPNLFVGAFATSAPVQAQLEFSQYFDVVARSVGPQCSKNLYASTGQLTALLNSTAGRAQLQKQFNLCGPIVSDNDVANFLSTLTGPIAGIVQYNEDNNSYEMYNIPTLCSRLESGSDPLEGLLNVFNDYNKFSNNTECTDISYDNFIQSMQPTSDARSWTYQTCLEFGYFQDAKNYGEQPFSPLISLKFYTQQCNDIFKNSPSQPFLPNVQYVNDFYGGNQLVTSNTVFANGDVDPWHVLGNYQTYQPQAMSDTILIEGTAHCADLYPPRSSDVAGLTAARAVQDALLSQWLNVPGSTAATSAAAPAAQPAAVASKKATRRHSHSKRN